jgi:hypothetical protein
MRRSLTTLAATMTAAGLLVVAAATAAVAQDDGDTTPTTTTGAPSGDRQDRPLGVRRAVHRIAARTAAEEIGVSVQELRDAVLGGQTVAAYAEAQGKDPAAVEAAIAAALTAKVDEAVANGRITAERAATVKDHADEIADRLVNSLPRRLENAPQP